jgi:hypothetical protein
VRLCCSLGGLGATDFSIFKTLNRAASALDASPRPGGAAPFRSAVLALEPRAPTSTGELPRSPLALIRWLLLKDEPFALAAAASPAACSAGPNTIEMGSLGAPAWRVGVRFG